MGSTTNENSKLEGCVAVLIPKGLHWSSDPEYLDWYLEFDDSEVGPFNRKHIWIDIPQEETLYVGQLIVIRQTNRRVRGTQGEEDMYKYWEIVKE